MLLLNEEERAVPKPTVSGIIAVLNQSRRIFPPLKKLLFEVFWFVFAAVEIVRFLRSLL
jgi:hypothetical protein